MPKGRESRGARWRERIEEAEDEGRRSALASKGCQWIVSGAGDERRVRRGGEEGEEQELEGQTDTARRKTTPVTRRHGGLGWAGDPCGMSQVASAQTG